MAGELDFSIERKGAAVIITPRGQFTVATVKEMDTTCSEEIRKNPEILALNLLKIDFIDSNAISLLVRLQKSAANRNIKFLLFDPNHTIREILEAVRLSKFFTLISSDEFDAIYRNA